MMNRRASRHAVVLTTLLIAGCSGFRAAEKVTDQYFFPPPPVPARIQFVRGFNGSIDVEKPSTFLELLGGSGSDQEYRFAKPFSVATWKGRIYVTDSYGLRGLNVLDLENRRFYVLGKDPKAGNLIKPIHVFVDQDGFKFVSDLSRRRVVVYDPDDRYVRTYGDGKSFIPAACVAHGDELFVLDIQKDRVEFTRYGETAHRNVRRDQILVLDRETGNPLRRIGQHAAGTEGFRYAGFLGIDRQGDLYVTYSLNHRVLKLDGEGNVLLSIGRHGDMVGCFAKPKGVALDRSGLIYVLDAEHGLAQVFDQAGNVLFFFGEPQAPKGAMQLPAGIWIDYHNLEHFRGLYGPDFEPEYLIVVANQVGTENLVAIYAFGKRDSHEYPPEDNVVTLERVQEVRHLWSMPVFPPDVHRQRDRLAGKEGF